MLRASNGPNNDVKNIWSLHTILICFAIFRRISIVFLEFSKTFFLSFGAAESLLSGLLTMSKFSDVYFNQLYWGPHIQYLMLKNIVEQTEATINEKQTAADAKKRIITLFYCDWCEYCFFFICNSAFSSMTNATKIPAAHIEHMKVAILTYVNLSE